MIKKNKSSRQLDFQLAAERIRTSGLREQLVCSQVKCRTDMNFVALEPYRWSCALRIFRLATTDSPYLTNYEPFSLYYEPSEQAIASEIPGPVW